MSPIFPNGSECKKRGGYWKCSGYVVTRGQGGDWDHWPLVPIHQLGRNGTLLWFIGATKQFQDTFNSLSCGDNFFKTYCALYEVFSWMLPQALSYRINKMCSILGHLLDLKIFYLCFQCYSIQTIEQISTNIRSLKTNISDKIAPGLEC